ncbi:hypothetical protein VP1G_10989 [Cytospora mali]|uniref:Uncharacterized protein n=1 Tax=Cytospora mali TaxID=578113 RepID=A0A194V1S6_CYTMA|nr:hypothetical protein VP1G_10989 [Valsa mali var. pyri (nom. inval.)]
MDCILHKGGQNVPIMPGHPVNLSAAAKWTGVLGNRIFGKKTSTVAVGGLLGTGDAGQWGLIEHETRTTSALRKSSLSKGQTCHSEQGLASPGLLWQSGDRRIDPPAAAADRGHEVADEPSSQICTMRLSASPEALICCHALVSPT